MDKILNSRLFRVLVCLILVCCILVNISPLKAEASAIVAGSVITGTGVFATLFAMSMGVVFVDLTADLINALGNSFVDHVTKSSSTDNETETLNVWIEPIQVDLDSGGISQLPPEQDDDTNTWGALAGLFTLPDELKDNFLSWAKDLINGETEVEVEEEVPADDGFAYYGDNQYPVLSENEGYPYQCIIKYKEYSLEFYYSENPLTLTSKLRYSLDGDKICRFFKDGAWGEESFQTGSTVFHPDVVVVWSNHDVFYPNSEEISVLGSSVSSTSTTTVPVLPDTYVGDIPQKVQNGDFDDDDLELPYINPIKLWENQTDAVDALNDVATQLQDQTMTYDQYMQQIQTSTGTNPGPGTDSGPSSDTWEPPENPGQFALDLSNYFPFCIPFDLYDFFSCLRAAPEAPVIDWNVPLPGGGSYPLVIDLSKFDDVAQLLRRLQLLLFCVGLAFKTRDLIKG